MIITKIVSGLGNQLFQYAVGRHLALKHNVELKLDIEFFNEHNLRSYKLNHYNNSAVVANKEEINSFLNLYTSYSLVAKVYRRFDKYIPKQYRRYFCEEEWWVYEPELFRTGPSVYIEGYWQHYRYFENIQPQILEELTLTSAYPTEAQLLLNAIQGDKSSVAIHIRRGDYITDVAAHKLMGVLPLSYYSQAVSYVKEKVKKPTFYIFSDDLQWAAEHLKLDAPIILVDIAGGNLDYIELDLMSKCQHVIIANSSFSWWGAFLNKNPNKVVVAPAQWVVPSEINQRIKLQLPSWKII